MRASEQLVRTLMKHAGVELNGSRPDGIVVHNARFFDRVANEGFLGFGESYMDGDWDCDQLDVLSFKIIRADIEAQVKKSPRMLWLGALSKLFNRQTKQRASKDVQSHYNIGNDLYEAMLDKRMTYTCGYWKNAKTLDQAQEAKLDLVCRKIGLKKGMTVLDIGCGWGSFAKYAAQKYGAKVVGVTIAKEQVALARELCKGLPVEIRLQDYRDVNDQFDRIVSLGMFEHVGHKNYREYFRVARRCLKDDGMFLLHTIGSSWDMYGSDPWMDKYIFPGGALPGVAQLGKALEHQFVIEDWHNFGQDYDSTLIAWWKNFDKNYDKLKSRYNSRFYRMWRMYLLGTAGNFRARNIHLWQLVLTKQGIVGGYNAVR
jgi:cyclopropane-fatty-acyl-phospholipid synthase